MASIVTAACQLVVGSVFLRAGLYKFMNSKTFGASLLSYSFGSLTRNLLIIVLPAFELLLGAAILLDVGMQLTSIAVMVLAIYSIVFFVFRKNDGEECGCMGRIFDPHSKGLLLLRNLLLIGVGGTLLAVKADSAARPAGYEVAVAIVGMLILGLPVARHLILSYLSGTRISINSAGAADTGVAGAALIERRPAGTVTALALPRKLPRN